MKCYFCEKSIEQSNRIYKITPCLVLDLNSLEYNFNEESFVIHERCLSSYNKKTVEIPTQSVERNNILQFLETN